MEIVTKRCGGVASGIDANCLYGPKSGFSADVTFYESKVEITESKWTTYTRTRNIRMS